MQQPVGEQPVRPKGPAADRVEVRFWAALRAAAGVDVQRVPAGSLAEVLAAVAARHAGTPRFAQVLAICSVLLDEQPVGARDRTEVDVPAGSTVDLLPPFAGGAPRHSPGGTSAE